MQPTLTAPCPTPRIAQTFSTARSTRVTHFTGERSRHEVEDMLREIATVLHYTRVCRELKA